MHSAVRPKQAIPMPQSFCPCLSSVVLVFFLLGLSFSPAYTRNNSVSVLNSRVQSSVLIISVILMSVHLYNLVLVVFATRTVPMVLLRYGGQRWIETGQVVSSVALVAEQQILGLLFARTDPTAALLAVNVHIIHARFADQRYPPPFVTYRRNLQRRTIFQQFRFLNCIDFTLWIQFTIVHRSVVAAEMINLL